jgi:hypothetical protein
MLLLVLINSFVIALAVAVHYEFLFYATRLIPRMNIKPRQRIIFGVFTALVAHAVEVWIFAFAYYFLHHQGTWGQLEGNYNGTLLDSAYFSFTTYSTLGFGDIQPMGDIRFLTGLESLTGLVLVTWSASFLYFEMQRLWSSG